MTFTYIYKSAYQKLRLTSRVAVAALVGGGIVVFGGSLGTQPVAARAADTTNSVCSGVSVGPAQEVVSNTTRQQLNLGTWSDIQQGALRNSDGSYQFLGTAADGGSNPQYPQRPIVTHGTLDNPVAYSAQTAPAITNVPAGYSWVGGGPVYRDPSTGTILQMMHMEKKLSDGVHYYTQLALGRVDPTTFRTTYLGMIVQPTITYTAANSMNVNVDLGAPSFVVQNGYLNIYFDDFIAYNGRAVMQTPAIAHTTLSAAITAAQNGQVTAWQKYAGGTTGWNSSALGGPSVSLMPGAQQLWSPSAAYDSTLGSTIMVSPVSPTEAVLTSSIDGMTNWTAEQPLLSDPGKFDAYYTLVNATGDPSQLGQQFYLYYLQWQNTNRDWSNAHILRRTITCTGGQTASNVPLMRYTNGTRHIVTTAMVNTPGYYSERSGSWQLLSAATPGTHPLYSCLLGSQDYFIYTAGDCGGFTTIQTEGWIYDSAPSVPNVALYRCYLSNIGDHFVTTDPNCEGSGANNDGLLGYAPTSTKVTFSRYYNGNDHWDTTGAVTSSYQALKQWQIEASAQLGTTQIFGCEYTKPGGIEHFTSTQSTCEGATVDGSEGWLYATPPTGVTSVPLYRCYDGTNYDHFLATDTSCEGNTHATLEGLLGYALPLH